MSVIEIVDFLVIHLGIVWVLILIRQVGKQVTHLDRKISATDSVQRFMATHASDPVEALRILRQKQP